MGASTGATLEQLRLAIERSEDTSFGCLIDKQDKLLSTAFGRSSETVQTHLVEYANRTGTVVPIGRHPLTREMVRLFNGDEPARRINYNTEGVSKFQRMVYEVLERIPRGKVTTYGLISKLLGSAPRAVGGAVASNPWPLFIPCQRVVNFDLTFGNYGLCGALTREGTVTKRALLERERVPIVEGRIGPTAVWDPSRK